MLLVTLSHPNSGWSMVKFSQMLKDAIEQNFDEVTFVKPTNIISERISNSYLRKIAIYFEKKILFSVYILYVSKRIRAKKLLIADHSDSLLTFLVWGIDRIVVCHDLFAIQAMLGHIQNVNQSIREKFELRLNYQTLKWAKRILAVSNSTAKTVKLYLPQASVQILPLTVSKVVKSNPSVNLIDSLQPRHFCILPMNSHWRKNRIAGIRSWSEIRNVIPEFDLKLLIIGNNLDAEELCYLNNSGNFSSLYIKQNIGEEELSNLYQSCQFVIFTSLYEGFGLPIIESNSHGKLTLHSDIEVLNEIGGTCNVRLKAGDGENDWLSIWNKLSNSENRKLAQDYYHKTYSNELFTLRLKHILTNAE
jgi:glycosyltransferase involved in cell wall biosynthesis